MTMKAVLKQAAKAGRHGDTELLHVSKQELKGLASLHPEGKLPKNPDTGLPEAFFFLPFLAGLGSMFGGAAATGATLGATAAATTAAIPAATTAATLGSTLGTAALPAAAETAALSAVPATTAALPAATSALTGAMSTPTLLGSGGLDTLAATAPSTTAPLFNGAMNAATTGAITPSPLEAAVAPTTTASNIAAPSVTASPLSTTVEAPSTIPGLNAATPSATLLGPVPNTTSGLLGGSGLSSLLQYGALGAMMMPQSAPEMEDDKEPKIGKDTYHRGKANFDDSGDGEHDYFPNSHYSNEENKKGKRIKFASGGLVRGFAEGGLASMDGGGAPPDDNALIDATRDAIVQQSPEADALIQQFLAVFGKQALQDLIAGIQQGGAPQGDGMSDSIPAQTSDGGLASLSDGEYVVSADAVSGLGNGSTDAGAKHLDGMVDRIRQVRNGGKQQPPALDPSQMMPA